MGAFTQMTMNFGFAPEKGDHGTSADNNGKTHTQKPEPVQPVVTVKKNGAGPRLMPPPADKILVKEQEEVIPATTPTSEEEIAAEEKPAFEQLSLIEELPAAEAEISVADAGDEVSAEIGNQEENIYSEETEQVLEATGPINYPVTESIPVVEEASEEKVVHAAEETSSNNEAPSVETPEPPAVLSNIEPVLTETGSEEIPQGLAIEPGEKTFSVRTEEPVTVTETVAAIAPSADSLVTEVREADSTDTVPAGNPQQAEADQFSDNDDDATIEFEFDDILTDENENNLEKQVAIAYFEKATITGDDGEEVFEIPVYSKPTTGPDARPVVIVRVKEKKEPGTDKPRASKRGRKSVREMMADAEMVAVPEDEELFRKQYYGIGEVAQMFGANTSLIRFWETEFDIIKPKKNKKGDRFFRPVDVKNLHIIYNLLRLKKFTIEGAKDYLKNNRKKAEKNFEVEQSLKRIRQFLFQLKADL